MKLDLNKINLNKTLGEGGFAKVYPYEKKPGCTKYVVKVHSDLEFDKLQRALQEVFVASNLRHPAILPYKDFRMERDKEKSGVYQLYIKTARMKMSLRQLIHDRILSNKGYFPMSVVLEFIKTLLDGLLFLSKAKIAHRDIKPANILVNFNDKLVIADLGEAKHSLDDETTEGELSLRGTYPFMAPELISSEARQQMKKKDLLKADVWSMGLTILEICSLRQGRPFRLEEKRRTAICKDLDDVRRFYGASLEGLIKDMLDYDPIKRKSIEKIYEDFQQKFCSQEFNGRMMPQNNSRQSQEEEKTSNLTHKSLTPLNSFSPQQNPPSLHFSAPDYIHIYNSVNNENGEKEMMKKFQGLFHFKFDDFPTISLPKSSSQGFAESALKLEEMMDQFSKTIELHKMKISSLNIDFSCFSDFRDEHFNNLINEINKTIPNLKGLSLNFGHCPSLTPEVMRTLEQYFSTNRDLEKFSLNFDENQNINGDFLSKISSDIQKYLANLKSLSLSFENCSRIGFVEVKDLDRSLGKLKKLKDLTLNFKSCPGMVSIVRTHLEVTLTKSIHDLNFNFNE